MKLIELNFIFDNILRTCYKIFHSSLCLNKSHLTFHIHYIFQSIWLWLFLQFQIVIILFVIIENDLWLSIQNFLLNCCIFEMLVTCYEFKEIAILKRFTFLTIINDIVCTIMLLMRLLRRLRREKLIKCRVTHPLTLFFLFNICISIFIGGGNP